ncbi:MAG: sulfite exporter TauE/SafE family protein [Pseudomonadota bacterium]
MPEGINNWVFVGLVATSLTTSFISASLGIGGGLLLLVTMANVIPPFALIPVHGAVQLGSNANRMLMTRQHIQWALVTLFLGGAICAAFLASFVLVQLTISVIQISIGIFVLCLVWGFKPKKKELGKLLRFLSGFVTTFLTMFVGATGPLVAALIHSERSDKHQLIATFSSCMCCQHTLKLILFISIGFAFLPWLSMIILMVIAGSVGTWLGLKCLNKIPARVFDRTFKILITALALRTLYLGITASV